MSEGEDAERGALIEGGEGGGTLKKSPDWSRYGLSREQQASSQKHYEATVDTGDVGQHNELYREEQVSGRMCVFLFVCVYVYVCVCVCVCVCVLTVFCMFCVTCTHAVKSDLIPLSFLLSVGSVITLGFFFFC